MRRVRILVSIALLATAGGSHAASQVATGSGPLAAKAAVDFAVTVPRVMRMQLLDHPPTVSVTPEDIARGYVRVSGPRVDLLVNDRQGYSVRAEIMGTAFTEARISGLPGAIVATREAALAQMPTMVGRARPQPFNVVYELKLSPGATAGQHAWPVGLTLSNF